MKIGDHVTISTKYSTFDKMTGVIIDIVEGTPLPFTVKLDNPEDDEEMYFSEEELLV